jgi:hypothetical protein
VGRVIIELLLKQFFNMNNPRDLTGTIESINYALERDEGLARSAIRKAEENPDDPHQYGLISVPSHLARGLLQRYARGDTLAELHQYFHDSYLPAMRHATQLSARIFPDHQLALHFEQTASWMLLFALVCFDDDGTQMAQLDQWFTPDGNPVLYAMVRKALDRGFQYADEYDIGSEAVPHEAQLVAALLQPRDTWPKAFAAYMKQWPRLMKKYGYREHVDADKHRFEFFPLHLALAVCAYDVDDSGFRHLPYYPADLVEYYRGHIRHQRDAWRSGVINPAAGLPASARPQPKKTYELSMGEAYERWIEIVCGEQPALIEAARKAAGKRKTMPPLDTLMPALASAQLATHADLKDDETVAAQVDAMCRTWQLPAPVVPATGQQGAARITRIFNALQDLDTAQGQKLALLDDGGDNWNAIFYSHHHEAEFTTLCEQLGIRRMDRSQWQ